MHVVRIVIGCVALFLMAVSGYVVWNPEIVCDPDKLTECLILSLRPGMITAKLLGIPEVEYLDQFDASDVVQALRMFGVTAFGWFGVIAVYCFWKELIDAYWEGVTDNVMYHILRSVLRCKPLRFIRWMLSKSPRTLALVPPPEDDIQESEEGRD